eukprot:Plantae.Rhodophyta-Purpureofilum_apyrenoidigerum.ctg18524.p2 GENE.Plantae.Rhodophyta-Purpureofilum_apyrenoidigerum.ctg18524~~Plantae.Rhodophyta-Purpureofilum_apyrenoidigerum.ctg18524.p2  ORF type:complete len:117 (+),score=13.53 Plantae.Rhodophyta-Purpureofilum_apyrenoidigerum.ctg18524:63-413(+)
MCECVGIPFFFRAGNVVTFCGDCSRRGGDAALVVALDVSFERAHDAERVVTKLARERPLLLVHEPDVLVEVLLEPKVPVALFALERLLLLVDGADVAREVGSDGELRRAHAARKRT